VVSGPYVFRVAGPTLRSSRWELQEITSGGTGTIPEFGCGLRRERHGTIKASDTTLAGSYVLIHLFPGSGRGTITLTSTSTGRSSTFYVVDSTHLRLVENDSAAYLGGDATRERRAVRFRQRP